MKSHFRFLVRELASTEDDCYFTKEISYRIIVLGSKAISVKDTVCSS